MAVPALLTDITDMLIWMPVVTKLETGVTVKSAWPVDTIDPHVHENVPVLTAEVNVDCTLAVRAPAVSCTANIVWPDAVCILVASTASMVQLTMRPALLAEVIPPIRRSELDVLFVRPAFVMYGMNLSKPPVASAITSALL